MRVRAFGSLLGACAVLLTGVSAAAEQTPPPSGVAEGLLQVCLNVADYGGRFPAAAALQQVGFQQGGPAGLSSAQLQALAPSWGAELIAHRAVERGTAILFASPARSTCTVLLLGRSGAVDATAVDLWFGAEPAPFRRVSDTTSSGLRQRLYRWKQPRGALEIRMTHPADQAGPSGDAVRPALIVTIRRAN